MKQSFNFLRASRSIAKTGFSLAVAFFPKRCLHWDQVGEGSREVQCPTDPDLADVVGDTDLDFENVFFKKD